MHFALEILYNLENKPPLKYKPPSNISPPALCRLFTLENKPPLKFVKFQFVLSMKALCDSCFQLLHLKLAYIYHTEVSLYGCATKM